jgi:hypothetical protein
MLKRENNKDKTKELLDSLVEDISSLNLNGNESQKHGLIVENSIKSCLNVSIKPKDTKKNYTVKMDISSKDNCHNTNISIKCSKLSKSIKVDCGDLIRFIGSEKDFVMIVAVWEQKNNNKLIKISYQLLFDKILKNKLFGYLLDKDNKIKDDLKTYVKTIKTFSKIDRQDKAKLLKFRKEKNNEKKQYDSELFKVHNKINKDQSRVQCSFSIIKLMNSIEKDIESNPNSESKKIIIKKYNGSKFVLDDKEYKYINCFQSSVRVRNKKNK